MGRFRRSPGQVGGVLVVPDHVTQDADPSRAILDAPADVVRADHLGHFTCW